MRHSVRAVLLAAGLVLFACGHKNRPVAPELVRPEAPEQLTAIATPDGVRLGWLRPLRYSGGQRMNDLRGFVIERAMDAGPTRTSSRASPTSIA